MAWNKTREEERKKNNKTNKRTKQQEKKRKPKAKSAVCLVLLSLFQVSTLLGGIAEKKK